MTPKYLIFRRDGTQPPWPRFVLAGPDAAAEVALRAYAAELRRQGGHEDAYIEDVEDLADDFARWRKRQGARVPGVVAANAPTDTTVRAFLADAGLSFTSISSSIAERILPLLRAAHADAWVNMRVKDRIVAVINILEGRR